MLLYQVFLCYTHNGSQAYVELKSCVDEYDGYLERGSGFFIVESDKQIKEISERIIRVLDKRHGESIAVFYVGNDIYSGSHMNANMAIWFFDPRHYHVASPPVCIEDLHNNIEQPQDAFQIENNSNHIRNT